MKESKIAAIFCTLTLRSHVRKPLRRNDVNIALVNYVIKDWNLSIYVPLSLWSVFVRPIGMRSENY